jgi:hypothetical protein
MTMPADRNVVQKEGGKELKYNSLCTYRDTRNVEHEILQRESFSPLRFRHRHVIIIIIIIIIINGKC